MRFVSSNKRFKGEDILAERFARGSLFTAIEVARLDFLGLIPLQFEHQLHRHE